jgi:hypothetical protein
MYQNHAAREHTIVFPAWKKNCSDKQLDQISEQLEDIEHKMFGKDGFEDAKGRLAASRLRWGSVILRNLLHLRRPNLSRVHCISLDTRWSPAAP